MTAAGWSRGWTATACAQCALRHHRWLLVVGSEAGMVEVPEESVAEERPRWARRDDRRRLRRRPVYHDTQFKDLLAARDIMRRGSANRSLDDILRPPTFKGTRFPEDLRRRQHCFGLTHGRYGDDPAADDREAARKPIGSMGDDAPVAVLSRSVPRHAPLLPPEPSAR